jgi:hypothetical protein
VLFIELLTFDVIFHQKAKNRQFYRVCVRRKTQQEKSVCSKSFFFIIIKCHKHDYTIQYFAENDLLVFVL